MKKCKLMIISVALCLMLAVLAGCAWFENGVPFPSLGGGGLPQAGTPHSSASGIADRLTTDGEKIVRFDNGSVTNLHQSLQVANGYANGDPFDCFWSSANAYLANNRLNLSLTKGTNYSRGRTYEYVGAEVRSWWNGYSYGFYSVSMKAADCSGVISSFFTYTSNPWDEIDIEFLGKDMTSVQFNYYTKGVGGHEFVYKLGFDASKDFHEYAFLWLADSITWYVDGKAVYRATSNIPTTSTQIMMNVWNCAGNDRWSGKFDTTSVPVSAEYQWIGYSAA